jgi:hypothetical protein
MDSLGLAELVDLGRSLSSLIPRLSSRQQQLLSTSQESLAPPPPDACARLVQRASRIWIHLKSDGEEAISESKEFDPSFWSGWDAAVGAVGLNAITEAAVGDLLALLQLIPPPPPPPPVYYATSLTAPSPLSSPSGGPRKEEEAGSGPSLRDPTQALLSSLQTAPGTTALAQEAMGVALAECLQCWPEYVRWDGERIRVHLYCW